MSTFINNDITNGGRILLAKGHMGERINFTRIVMGDGFMPNNTAIRDMVNVVNPIINIPISKKRHNADGTVIIGGNFHNKDIAEAFFYRELALFAESEDGTESLYCYGNAGEFAELITPIGDGNKIIEKVIDIITAVSTTTQVTANIVRAASAHEILFDDRRAGLGAEDVQEAIELLAKSDGNKIPIIIISENEPIEPCEIWLKPAGNIRFDIPEVGDGSGENNPAPMPLQELNFYTAHNYDKNKRQFFPFALMNTAQNVLLNPSGTETVSDAITQLHGARIYLMTEIFTHINDTSVHTNAEQINNALAAIAELVLHAQNNDIHVTIADKNAWNGGVLTAERALLLAEQSLEGIAQFENRIARLEDGLFNNITGNPFLISFDDLSGISIIKGIWNRERQRIEC